MRACALLCLACTGLAYYIHKNADDEMHALATILLALNAQVPRMRSAVYSRPTGVQMSTNPDAPIKLGVNGFGRIGRQVVRIAMDKDDFVVKHINSPMSPEYMRFLLEHDTVHGRLPGAVKLSDTGLIINGILETLSATHDPIEIPWKDAGVEYVCESTGVATASQLTVDGSMKGVDWRAGRAASANIIPSSTGAAKAVAKAYPVMKSKLTRMVFRVPTVDVSVVDLTCELETEISYDDIKAEVKLASETCAKGVVGYTEDQVVSSDSVGETCSTVFDAGAGIMLTPTFVKLVSWYDNEWGYSTRLVDLVGSMAVKDDIKVRDESAICFTVRKVD